MSKIRYGAAEIIEEYDNGIRLIKFNGQFYTCYGRMFAVRGNHVGTPYDEACNSFKHYMFCDWEELRDMYLYE